MKNHWLSKKDYREFKNEHKHDGHGDPWATPESITVTTFDKALSQEEIKQLSTVEIVGDSITFEGDNIVLKGDVTIVGDLTVDGNLTITDCMEVCSENEVNITNCTIDGGMMIADRVENVSVIDCTFAPVEEKTISSIGSMMDRVISDIMAEEDQKVMETIMGTVA